MRISDFMEEVDKWALQKDLYLAQIWKVLSDLPAFAFSDGRLMRQIPSRAFTLFLVKDGDDFEIRDYREVMDDDTIKGIDHDLS